MATLASLVNETIPENRIRGVFEKIAFGAIAATPNGSGNITLTHGLAAEPTVLLVGLESDANGIQVENKGASATTSLLRVFALADGSDVTSGAQAGWFLAIV